MKNKFLKSDRFLLRAFLLTDIMTALILFAIVCYGILSMVLGSITTSIIIWGVVTIALIAPITAFCFNIFMKTVLYMYCDVKLIRNKLYGNSNDLFDDLIEEKSADSNDDKSGSTYNKTTDDSNASKPISKNVALLKELKGLLDNGVLTQSEFDDEKQKILSGANSADEQ